MFVQSKKSSTTLTQGLSPSFCIFTAVKCWPCLALYILQPFLASAHAWSYVGLEALLFEASLVLYSSVLSIVLFFIEKSFFYEYWDWLISLHCPFDQKFQIQIFSLSTRPLFSEWLDHQHWSFWVLPFFQQNQSLSWLVPSSLRLYMIQFYWLH